MKKWKKRPIYLAGGLFNAAEQVHNLFLEKHLKKLGYEVILPQREALKFKDKDGSLDMKQVRNMCQVAAADRANTYVGSIDGPDADSGTCVEYGIAITSAGRAVAYRTDIRTEPKKELGVNIMLTLPRTKLVLRPCALTELRDINAYYRRLAESIDKAISDLGP